MELLCREAMENLYAACAGHKLWPGLFVLVSSAVWAEQPPEIVGGSLSPATTDETAELPEYLAQTSLPPSPDLPAIPAQAGPVFSSQPPIFAVRQTTPVAATNDQNSSMGLRGSRILSRYLPGKFENTKYKWYGFVAYDKYQYRCR